MNAFENYTTEKALYEILIEIENAGITSFDDLKTHRSIYNRAAVVICEFVKSVLLKDRSLVRIHASRIEFEVYHNITTMHLMTKIGAVLSCEKDRRIGMAVTIIERKVIDVGRRKAKFSAELYVDFDEIAFDSLSEPAYLAFEVKEEFLGALSQVYRFSRFDAVSLVSSALGLEPKVLAERIDDKGLIEASNTVFKQVTELEIPADYFNSFDGGDECPAYSDVKHLALMISSSRSKTRKRLRRLSSCSYKLEKGT